MVDYASREQNEPLFCRSAPSPHYPGGLLLREILGAFQKQPPFAFENVLLTVGLELPDLAASDLVNRLVEFPHDVEAIEGTVESRNRK